MEQGQGQQRQPHHRQQLTQKAAVLMDDDTLRIVESVEFTDMQNLEYEPTSVKRGNASTLENTLFKSSPSSMRISLSKCIAI
mmetsp:Transcript_25536/g.37892  ORF Transcript_25536/g.37892 Transcript_25536/m.37892 type:complete len:82 (-) Transcript_25536:55-300(-)